jgi:hypothetical protein
MLKKSKTSSFWFCTFVAFTCGALLAGCQNHSPPRAHGDFSEGAMFKSDKEAPIPRSLVQHLEQNYISVFRETHPDSTLTDLEISLKVPRRLMQISVFMKEKNVGTMTANSRFQLPHGGGAIDLAGYVKQGKGLFHLDFNFDELTDDQANLIKVYFISNAKRFEISGQKFGAGCGKFFDVTDFFHSRIRKGGMELAAADMRYLGQVIGSFVFSYLEPTALHIGSVTFLDTRYPDSHCTFSGQ